MTADALIFDHVSKAYGAVRALDDVTLSVRRGEMFGLIGPDGAGKTTAIRLACGLLRPDAGGVRVLGHDPVASHQSVTGAVGYLSQRFSLYGDLTIDENIAFQAELHGVRRYGPARDRLLDMTQLTPFRKRRADRLSGGMKQKLALACTLIHEPDLLLLDEPTTGVDPVSRREFWKLLSEFIAQGLTIIMTTPYLDEAERCARIALLHEGRIVALEDPTVLQSSMAGTLVEVVVDAPRAPVDLLSSLDGVEDVQVFGDGAHVHLTGRDPSVFIDTLKKTFDRQGIQPISIRPVMPSLEDVFIDLVTRGAK